MTTSQRQEGDRQLIDSLIDLLVSGDMHTRLAVPPQASLGRWLKLYDRPHLEPWQTRQLAQIIDPDGLGLASRGDTGLELSARWVLRFYGYPNAATAAQQGALLDALRRRRGFAGADLQRSFDGVHADLLTLAQALKALVSQLDLAEDTFGRLDLHLTRCQLTSGSYWAQTLDHGARLLQAIVAHPAFVALVPSGDAPLDAFAFDPVTGSISGHGFHVSHEQLLALPLEGQLDLLTRLGEHSRLTLHQDACLSLAQLLALHQLALPDSRDALLDLVEQLPRTEPLWVMPACDYADSDIALRQYEQANASVVSVPLRWGNYWACLQPGALCLSSTQRNAVVAQVAPLLPSANSRLLGLWLGDVRAAHPDDSLHRLLNSAAAQQLAQRLIAAVHWYGQAPGETTSRAARDALVLGALILNLDPQAGTRPYHIAGLDLRQPALRGCRYAAVRQAVELHLIDQGVASAGTCGLAAHILLSGVAPECVVPGIPDSLSYLRSYAWIVFKQGVLQAEALADGAARHLHFNAIMKLADDKVSAAQQPWREHCATAALIEWGVAQGELTPADERQAYAAADLAALKQRLAPRMQALKQAAAALTMPLVTRRALALADLQRVFAGQSWLETRCLHWVQVPGTAPPFSRPRDTRRYSLLELHMSGHLQPLASAWRCEDPGVPLERIKQRLGDLGQINRQFSAGASDRIGRLKAAYALAIQYLLWQLPEADRAFLAQADLQLLALRLPAKVPLSDESVAAKMARTGRFGVLLRGCQGNRVRHYELFPLLNRIQHNPRLPAQLNVGGVPLGIHTGSAISAQPRNVLFTGSPLAVDWPAYASARAPRPGQRAVVIVDRLPFDRPQQTETDLGFDSPTSIAIAQAIVSQHFFLDVDALLASARGSNTLERERQFADYLFEFLANLIPFRACANGVSSGDTRQVIDSAWSCFFDIFGLFTPTRTFGSGVVSNLKRNLPSARKLWLLSQLSAQYLNAAINPLESVPSLLRLGSRGLVRLYRNGRLLLDHAVGQARHRLARGGGLDYSRLVDRADVGKACLLHNDGLHRLLALRRGDDWLAFDPFSARAYGPVLNDLRLEASLAVRPHGANALLVEPLYDQLPLIIHRADATDLLHDQRLWRLATDRLDDITSPAFTRLADVLEPACRLRRRKRSPATVACFSKKIYRFRQSIHQRRVQALDHIRLIPPADTPMLVLHRRRYVLDASGELTALPQHEPLRYKPHVDARRIDDEPQFGLPEDDLDNLLERHSQVVTLNAIVEGIDDRRTLRALVVTRPGVDAPRWVVEADTGVFYQTLARSDGPDALLFEQLDYSLGGDHQRLIEAFCAQRNEYLRAGGFIPDQPLVALPTLQTLFLQLIARGTRPERMARLSEQASRLSLFKQRELLFNVADQGRGFGINVVSRPIQLDTWPPRPTTLDIPTPEEIHRHLAEHANASTVALVERTGIGSANKVAQGVDDMRRLEVAEPVVMWEYSKIGHPNYTEVILKTGAGNCDQMAHVACEMIRTNGGSAHIWHTHPAAHAFVVVGPTPMPQASTVDFSEAVWADAWVCDPWTRITCPAADYMRTLHTKMIAWYLEDISVLLRENDEYRWVMANDPAWLKRLIDSTKQPFR